MIVVTAGGYVRNSHRHDGHSPTVPAAVEQQLGSGGDHPEEFTDRIGHCCIAPSRREVAAESSARGRSAFPSARVKVRTYGSPADFRRGIDGQDHLPSLNATVAAGTRRSSSQ